jgi:hypothetical protein
LKQHDSKKFSFENSRRARTTTTSTTYSFSFAIIPATRERERAPCFYIEQELGLRGWKEADSWRKEKEAKD